MPWLIHQLHHDNVTVALYTSVGDTTCDNGGRNGSIPGSYGRFALDLRTFVEWEVDGIIADCCGNCRSWNVSAAGLYVNFSDTMVAVESSKRPIYLQGDAALQYLLWDVGQYYNAWQAFADHHDSWRSTVETITMVQFLDVPGTPGAWPYMDVLMTGGQGCKTNVPNSSSWHCPGQTETEYVTEFTMWSLMQSPLIIGTDLRNLTDVMKRVLFNEKLIDIHQRTDAPPGKFMAFDKQCNSSVVLGPVHCQLWGRSLSTTRALIVLFNSGDVSVLITANVTALFGWREMTNITIDDVWSDHSSSVSSSNVFSRVVSPHGVFAAIVSKSD